MVVSVNVYPGSKQRRLHDSRALGGRQVVVATLLAKNSLLDSCGRERKRRALLQYVLLANFAKLNSS